MRFASFLLFAAIIALAFGFGFAIAPGAILGPYGITTDAAGLLMARFFGASLINLGLVLFLVRGVTDGSAQRAIAKGSFMGSIIGLVVAVSGQVSGIVHALGWSSVVIYVVLAVGYGYLAFGGVRVV